MLRRRGWLLSDISRLANVLHITVLDGLNEHIPDGIRFHLDDIFTEELDQAASDGQVRLFPIKLASKRCIISDSEADLFDESIYAL